MLKKIMGFWKDELIKSGLILFIAVNSFNLLNYVYHFVIARMLSPENYGVLMTLFSFFYIFSVPSEALQTIISGYTSRLANNDGKIKSLLLRSMKKAGVVSFLFYILFIPISLFFSYFLSIEFPLFMITGIALFGFFLTPIIRGVLQGKKKFKELGISMNFEAIVKVIMGIGLVYLAKNVYGAVFAVILSIFFGFLISLFFVKNILSAEKENVRIKGAFSYSWPVFVLFFAIVLMYSLDVIIAKRIFSPEMVGKYAVVSILGKAIFFATNGFGKSMFPISNEKKARHEKRKVLKKSLIMVSLLCFAALIAFLIFPELIIKILFGSKYIDMAGILIFTGLAFSFLSITNLIVLHKISKGRLKNPGFMLIFVLAEIIGLALFSQNIERFSIALCFANLFMLIGSFFIRNKK